MRKIIVSEMVTVDGFFAGSNGEINWHRVDQEFNDYAIELLDHVDTFLFGRITYELMASYWPTANAKNDDPMVAERMNAKQKIVFSNTAGKFDWENSKRFEGDMATEISKLKQVEGKDIAIYGSGTIVRALTDLGLIDEYRFIVSPIILGAGKSLFDGVKGKTNLKLKQTKEFKNGNVLLFYIPA